VTRLPSARSASRGVAEVGRGPQHGGVGDQGEAQRLVDLVVEVPSPDVTLMGEEQIAAQGVQALALVQLAADSTTQLLIGDVVAEIDGAHEPAVFLQRSGE